MLFRSDIYAVARFKTGVFHLQEGPCWIYYPIERRGSNQLLHHQPLLDAPNQLPQISAFNPALLLTTAPNT
jgi:hypothetical protein